MPHWSTKEKKPLAPIFLVQPEDLWRRFEQTRFRHVRLKMLVRASTVDDPEVVATAMKYLRRWEKSYNRLSVRPSRSQLEQLETAIADPAASLDAHVAHELAAAVAYAKHNLI